MNQIVSPQHGVLNATNYTLPMAMLIREVSSISCLVISPISESISFLDIILLFYNVTDGFSLRRVQISEIIIQS